MVLNLEEKKEGRDGAKVHIHWYDVETGTNHLPNKSLPRYGSFCKTGRT